jgi:hypothetical protein
VTESHCVTQAVIKFAILSLPSAGNIGILYYAQFNKFTYRKELHSEILNRSIFRETKVEEESGKGTLLSTLK